MIWMVSNDINGLREDVDMEELKEGWKVANRIVKAKNEVVGD